jgi:hypothetical protein
MSHRSSGSLFFILASFALVSVLRAQEPSTADAARAQSGQQPQSRPQSQPQPQPQSQLQPQVETPKTETASPSDQSPTVSSPPAASSSPSAGNKSASLTTITVNGGPSADILRSARNAGFTIKIANGTTHFCKTEAPIGTHFVSERCMSEEQVTLWLSRAQDQREKLGHLLGAPAVTH